MLARRQFVASAASTLLLPAGAARPAFAQTGATDTPAGTSPFPPDVYRERRRRVMEEMKGGIAVLFGADAPASTGPVSPLFQQSRHFAYLTGIVDEPGAVLVLAPRERTYREFLLLAPRNPEVERIDGWRLPLGTEVERRTGFAMVYRRGRLGGLVTELAGRGGDLHFLGPVASADAPVSPELDLYGKVAARVPGSKIVNSSGILTRMRLVKEPREIDLLQKAVDATRGGLEAAMTSVRPGQRESELKSIIRRRFETAGASGLAYDLIVGTGRNGTALHYTGGNGLIQDGDLVLCDVGAAFGHYASDVTRTFPANGRFTSEQRRVYELVLRAQEAAMSQLRAGVDFETLNEAARRVIAEAGHADDFYHGLGHFVGLDVHDVGDRTVPIPAGAVLTIEPGVYLQARNFGIRIEDQFLVTQTGYRHMSAAVPRTVAEIEGFMTARRG